MRTRTKGGSMTTKNKRRGFDLTVKSFRGRDGRSYIIFRTATGSYHSFVEVEAKEAARQCGATKERNTRAMWKSIWHAKAV
jgi:hypothetical protein